MLQSLRAFDSFSVKSSSGAPSRLERQAPVILAVDVDRGEARTRLAGAQPLPPHVPRPHDHVLRNQIVGSTWTVASSGPRLKTRMRMRMSSGELFAYSVKTSK